LLREVGRNQDELEQRVSEYGFKQKETDRAIDSKGVIKKETVKVYDVFPIPNREAVLKLISENGVELTGERAAKEEKRVLEELEKAEREREKDRRDAERKKAELAKKRETSKQEDDPGISQFLRACEFVSPRREQLNGRHAIDRVLAFVPAIALRV
jgi:exoribonuclease R